MHMLRSFTLSIVAAFAFASSAYAGMVQVDFSGGSGTPLTITLPQPVSYTVVNFPTVGNATFVFQGTGNMFSGSIGASGSLSFTQNAGALIPIDGAQQFNQADTTLNDLAFYNQTFFGLNHSDVILLSAGSVTTTSNIAAPAPPSGLYSTFLTDGASREMGEGTAVPEPTTLMLFALAAPILLRRRINSSPSSSTVAE
jgi:hypothetical protein